MMTKQDFVRIERIFQSRIHKNSRRSTFPCQAAISAELRGLAIELANELERNVSNFKKAKFLKGCGF